MSIFYPWPAKSHDLHTLFLKAWLLAREINVCLLFAELHTQER